MERFWEIDFLRGTAVLMMIAFHMLYDLNYFGLASLNVETGFWKWFAVATASIFVTLVGVSLSISHSRRRDYRRHFVRGMKIFLLGLAATIVTWLFIGDGFVVFGILHFIGLGIILAYPFLRLGRLNLAIGLIFVAIGIYLYSVLFDFRFLLWLGLRPYGFHTVDYFPLFPWFGLILIGLFLGKNLYPEGKRKFGFEMPEMLPRKVCRLGRHSLLIYVVHQPVIVALIYLLANA
jgi:uncharacterized membrane protein